MRYLRKVTNNILPKRAPKKKEYPIKRLIPNEGGGITVIEYPDIIEIRKDSHIIKISQRHAMYVQDILDSFDYYFNAVVALPCDGIYLVDYSKPAKHRVRGFDLFDVMFPSFAEGPESTMQYIEFAQLTEDSIVLDLGAYSGLTSIQFDMEIAKHNSKASGRVIAVDADPQNIAIIYYNFAQYTHICGRTIEYLHAACSDKDAMVEFSSEGNMGAALTGCVGTKRADRIESIQGITLSSIAKKYHLPKVDFIKCDIEGSELFIFKDKEFFSRFSPRIIFEPHYTRFDGGKELTSHTAIAHLAEYGYSCTVVTQSDVSLPLVECVK